MGNAVPLFNNLKEYKMTRTNIKGVFYETDNDYLISFGDEIVKTDL